MNFPFTTRLAEKTVDFDVIVFHFGIYIGGETLLTATNLIVRFTAGFYFGLVRSVSHLICVLLRGSALRSTLLIHKTVSIGYEMPPTWQTKHLPIILEDSNKVLSP